LTEQQWPICEGSDDIKEHQIERVREQETNPRPVALPFDRGVGDWAFGTSCAR
jgi:hypothetical protein